ncbi:Pycsar system effector family protein [Leifsonia sp. NPDC102414]|uniref:Pycsar system effector family protein n=1 Tax=Leifsonia sp. NPDC102414 TaxID=3364124 RepID=UPI003827D3FB
MRKRTSVDGHIEVAEAILREAREELSRADNKAALLLAAAGVIVGALLAAFIAGDWTPAKLPSCVQWLWWIGAASGCAGLFSLATAVYPRTKYRGQRAPAVVTYFGDVVNTLPSELKERLIATAKASDARVLDQVVIVSSIVDRKYRGIQFGLWMFGACGVLCTAAVLIGFLAHPGS